MSSLRCVCSVNVRVAFALAAVGGLAVGCGGDGSRGPVGGAWNPGGSGGIGGLTVGATCSGANPDLSNTARSMYSLGMRVHVEWSLGLQRRLSSQSPPLQRFKRWRRRCTNGCGHRCGQAFGCDHPYHWGGCERQRGRCRRFVEGFDRELLRQPLRRSMLRGSVLWGSLLWPIVPRRPVLW